MEQLDYSNAIAFREFELSNNPDEKVRVFIGKPFLVDNKSQEEWACPYRIVGAGQDINLKIKGVDSLQALQLVFKMIESAIIGADLSLLWLKEKDLGLS